MLSLEFKLAWGENCSKNRKIRAKVDSRIYGRWRLLLMGWAPGRYKWLKLPFTITSAPEMYQRAMDEMLEGVDHA